MNLAIFDPLRPFIFFENEYEVEFHFPESLQFNFWAGIPNALEYFTSVEIEPYLGADFKMKFAKKVVAFKKDSTMHIGRIEIREYPLTKRDKKTITQIVAKLPEMKHRSQKEIVLVSGPNGRYLGSVPKIINHKTEAEKAFKKFGWDGVHSYVKGVIDACKKTSETTKR